MKRAFATVLALAALSAAAPASANFGEALGAPTFVLTTGTLIPQERELDPGYHLGLAWLYDTSFGAAIGLEGTYSMSTDRLRTQFSALALHMRLGPEPTYHGAFVMMGFGAYNVGYDPKNELLPTPPSRVRPGGSFGLGFEFVNLGNLSVGASGAYHAVMMNRGDKLGWVEASATLTWRTFPF